MNEKKLLEFLQEQSSLAEFRSRPYIEDPKTHKKRPQRNIFVRLKKYVEDFKVWGSKIRWVTLTGLRGAWKTTVLFQLYSTISTDSFYKLFLSLDNTHWLLWANLNEVLETYEKILWRPFEMLNKPLFLFLDEVQYDSTWWVTLKTLYDRTDKVFIFSTWSAALILNTNADIARRTIFEKMHPLSFTEFLKISKSKYEIKWLSKEIRNAVLNSEDSHDCFEQLKKLEGKINEYYDWILQSDYQKYLWYWSLPHMVDFDNESIVYDQIRKTLEKVIHSDLPMVKFSTDTTSLIPWILYALSDMDTCNTTKFAEKFHISRDKMSEILDALTWAELLKRIYPYWSHLNQVVKKPSKYLFSAPAFRAIYFRLTSSIISDDNVKWKITEDLTAMYLYRIFEKKAEVSITYDSKQWGADFIVRVWKMTLVMEIGAGKNKGYKQVVQTMQKVDSQYGIVLSESELNHNPDHNIVRIPIRTFLLM